MWNLIRRATKEDISAINNLGSKLHENFAKTFHIETEIDSALAIVLVSVSAYGVNGYLYALDFGDNIDLLSIYVSESDRCKHVGTNLIKYLIKLADNKTITLEVSTDNIAAYNMYKKLDFKVVNVRRKYYNNADAYLMKWGG